jgi:type VI secretion system protein ImpJ
MGASTRQGRTQVRARSLSRVHWRLGQALLPDHLARQEDALLRLAALRHGPAAPWGVGAIEWDEVALARGTARLRSLWAVWPGGELAHVPGDARAGALDLDAAGGDVVTIHAHLLAEAEAERADPSASELEAVELVVRRVELSARPGHPGAIDSFALAEVGKGPDGVWALRPGHAPPLLTLDAWPSLLASVGERLRAVLGRWQDLLMADLAVDTLSLGRQVRAHEALRRSHLAESFLAQLGVAPARAATARPGSERERAAAGWPVHPRELFLRLVDLYVDVHDYQAPAPASPPLVDLTYDHDDIVAGFDALLGELEQRTRPPHGQVPYVAFTVRGRVASCPVPPAALAASELYWLVDRADGRADGRAASEPVRSIKLASPGRLDTVHRHALKGIGTAPLDRVPFRHDFAPLVAFHRITTDGEEWDHARREGALACLAESLGSARAYLFWR